MITSRDQLPWMKWYPADWRADPGLRMCSLAARGLWIELLGYMHEAPEYGSLIVGGAIPTPKQIALLVGESLPVVQGCLRELRDAGVFSIAPDGSIFSRRMKRDREKAVIDRENGLRGGNPRLNGHGNRTH